MKRYILAAAAAAALSAWTMPALAHGDDSDGPPPAEETGGPGHHDPVQMMERMKDKLGLSAEQSAKLKDAMTAHRDAMKPVRASMRDNMKKLHEQLEAKADDKDVQATLDALKAARASMQAEQDKMDKTLASFLTPTQRAKMLMGMLHHMREHAGWGPAGRHGPRMERGERRGPPPEDGDGPKDKDGDDD